MLKAVEWKRLTGSWLPKTKKQLAKKEIQYEAPVFDDILLTQRARILRQCAILAPSAADRDIYLADMYSLPQEVENFKSLGYSEREIANFLNDIENIEHNGGFIAPMAQLVRDTGLTRERIEMLKDLMTIYRKKFLDKKAPLTFVSSLFGDKEAKPKEASFKIPVEKEEQKSEAPFTYEKDVDTGDYIGDYKIDYDEVAEDISKEDIARMIKSINSVIPEELREKILDKMDELAAEDEMAKVEAEKATAANNGAPIPPVNPQQNTTQEDTQTVINFPGSEPVKAAEGPDTSFNPNQQAINEAAAAEVAKKAQTTNTTATPKGKGKKSQTQ